MWLQLGFWRFALFEFFDFVGETTALSSSFLKNVVDVFKSDEPMWTSIFVSQVVEIWAAPVVGLLAVIVATINIRKLQVQIHAAETEAKIRHVIEAANRKEEILRTVSDRRTGPTSDTVDAMVNHVREAGEWTLGENYDYQIDESTGHVSFFPMGEDRTSRSKFIVPFQRDIVYIAWHLQRDRAKTILSYHDPTSIFFGLRSAVDHFKSVWLHYLLLVRKAVELGYSEEAAGLMLFQWQAHVDILYEIGVIEAHEFELCKRMISASESLGSFFETET